MIDATATIGMDALAQPDELTTSLALLIVGLVTAILWAGIVLRSVVTLMSWLFVVLALVFSIVVQTDFVLFWGAIAIASVSLIASMVVKMSYGNRI